MSLCLAVLLVYAQVGNFEFTRYDDQYYVTENPVVLQGLGVQGVIWAFSRATNGAFMPITWLSHMLDVQMFGLNAGGHHLVNVVFHAINTILLFFLLLRCTSAMGRSAVAAALFALHPLHVESVVWIAERRDVLSTMWGILTIKLYLDWLERRTATGYILLLLCFLAALLAKPMTVTIPVVLLLLDIWPLNRLPMNGAMKRIWEQRVLVGRLVVEKIPLFLLAVVIGVLTIYFENSFVPLGTLESYPLSLRFGNAFVSYLQYLWSFFWPASLIPHYPYPKSIPMWQSIGAAVVLLLISIICIRKIQRQAYLAAGWFWFLLMLLPVMGLIQQGADFARADRYTYMPLIGVIVMVVWAGGELAGWLGWPRRVLIAAAVLVLLACGYLSFIQASYWRNNETLFSYTLIKSPGNHIALQQLGVEYRERGEYDKAYPLLDDDVRLNPENVDSLANFGQLLDRMGRLGEAIEYHQKAISINPSNHELYTNLGQVKARMGDLIGAEKSLGRALELKPDFLPARLNLGYVFYLRKNYAAATAQFSLVLAEDSKTADAYNGLGLVAMAKGNLTEAENYFTSALNLNPALHAARDNLQEVSRRLGRY